MYIYIHMCVYVFFRLGREGSIMIVVFEKPFCVPERRHGLDLRESFGTGG